MGQLFGPGVQDMRAVMTPEMMTHELRQFQGPQIGFGMPPSGEYGQPATDGSLDEDAFGYSGGSPGEEADQPAQPVAPPSGQKQYTFKNPDGTTYQHSLYKEPAQPVAPQQPKPPTDAEDNGAPGIVDDGGGNLEDMPGGIPIDMSKFFSKFGAGSGGPAIDPGINRGPQLGGGPAKTGPVATPMTLPQQPTQTQQPSWFAQTTDAQSPLLNTVGIWR